MTFFNRNNASTPRAPPPQSLGPGGTTPYERIPSPASSRIAPPPQSLPAPSPVRRPPPTDPYRQHQPTQYRDTPPPPSHPSREKYGQVAGAAGYGGEKAGSGGRGWPRLFDISACPNDALALTSRLVVSAADDYGTHEYVRVKGQYVLAIIRDPTGTIPPGHIAPSKSIRQWCAISQYGEQVEVEPYEYKNGDWAMSVDMEIGFMLKREESQVQYESEKLSELFISAFNGIAVQTLQPIIFDFHGVLMKATVRSVNTLDGMDGAPLGLVMDGTEIRWSKDPSTNMKLKNTGNRAPTTAIIAPNFKFEDMGIGGLDNEFAAIFRRAFASRIFPPGLIDKLGIQHVKGILLYGPPGTGKTLMARQIGKMLNAREPKIVNGPEILNKFVGQSEENIRKLFADAEKEQKEKGDESGLHIIIFDELDAICKQRGSTNSGTGVGDSVVNQLLAKMDGVDQLNNVLIIGMTNRKDMIDEALLRPGRLEVHIEISLPDEAGRIQILHIHTSKMKENGVMANDVDIEELAALTKNFSGAELNGLVKSATSFAFNRHVKVGTMAGISDDIENIKITRADFMSALDEVHAAFGVSEEELSQVVENGIIHFSREIDGILRDGNLFVQQVKNSERTPLVSVLVHGPSGSGKTALAATMALASDFPFIKIISPESMVGFSEGQKIAQLNKIFTDSYKSPLSVIVVDSIERLLDWIPIGPRFSNGVLQALAVLLGKRPPKGRRLLIFATTSNRAMLSDMELTDAFDADIRVPPITTLKAVDHVLREVDLFSSDQDYRTAARLLEQAGFGDEGRLNVGVKKLLSMAEMARQDPDPAEKLVGSLIQHSA